MDGGGVDEEDEGEGVERGGGIEVGRRRGEGVGGGGGGGVVEIGQHAFHEVGEGGRGGVGWDGNLVGMVWLGRWVG